VLEDDAQDGPDHVDAHRSIAFVISKYSPRRVEAGKQVPYIESTFYTTVNLLRTMEALTGAPPMNNNDARAAVMAPLFSGSGDQPAFDADRRNRDNGLIYQINAATSEHAEKFDFSHPDANDPAQFNRVLWKDRMGNQPMPAPRHSALFQLQGMRTILGANE
jgi:hypothetical protein